MTVGMVASGHVRPGHLPGDLEAMVSVASETSPAEPRLLRRGIWYAYRRFPPGLVVVEHEDRVVGYLQLGYQRPTFLTYSLGKMPWTPPPTFYHGLARRGILKDIEIANIVVSPKYQGRGVAYRLVRFAEEEAMRTYHEPAIILMVREENERAVRFYERLGYTRIGTKAVRVGKKLLMRKWLANNAAATRFS